MLDKIPTEINTENNDIIEIEIKDDYKTLYSIITATTSKDKLNDYKN